MTNEKATDLKPCPFCGNAEVKLITGEPLKHAWAQVICGLCETSGPMTGPYMDEIKRRAVEVWNRRAGE